MQFSRIYQKCEYLQPLSISCRCMDIADLVVGTLWDALLEPQASSHLSLNTINNTQHWLSIVCNLVLSIRKFYSYIDMSQIVLLIYNIWSDCKMWTEYFSDIYVSLHSLIWFPDGPNALYQNIIQILNIQIHTAR